MVIHRAALLLSAAVALRLRVAASAEQGRTLVRWEFYSAFYIFIVRPTLIMGWLFLYIQLVYSRHEI
jgi:hypothetical protein